MSGIRLLGMGGCVPQHIVTNDDMAQRVETSDAWISARTGIRRRHHCMEETQAQLCAQAAKEALAKSGIEPEEIGACIVATMTPETLMPSTACILQRELGLSQETLCFDLNAACSGFVFALHTMECLLASCSKKYGLVVGGEALSRIVNWEDRGTCILFGDGAGAAVVEYRDAWPSIAAVMGCDGNEELLYAAGPGSGNKPMIAMDGAKVFRFAVETISQCLDDVLLRSNKEMKDVDAFVFHQANARIIDLVIKKHSLPAEKVYKNLEEYGNTSAASIPLALWEMQKQEKIYSGSRILIVGFGGGLTWGGALIQFA